MFNRFALIALIVTLMILGAVVVCAEDSSKPSEEGPSTGHGEWMPMPTLGGKQFWADELFFRGWRIQRHALTDHCRLLDPKNRRHGWGTFEQCQAQLDQVKREQQLGPMTGRVVMVLHGLIRSRESMSSLSDHLEAHGYTVIRVSYPSTRRPIAAHAESLARLIEHLDGVEEINFVGHSLGNIVVRRYLTDQIDPATGRLRDQRVKRMVMLAPPNQGSRLATALAGNGAFATINGTPGQELGARWKALEAHLAVPPFEFGVIAGGRGDGRGYNPALPGDDDGTVRVASTHLKGETDFVLVPVLHSFIMSDPNVKEYTLHFLQQGRFREEKVTSEAQSGMIQKTY